METTQSKILQSALNCLNEKGFQKVTLMDIAKDAGVSRPTVYSYFKDRDEILQFVLLQSAYQVTEDIIAHIRKFNTPEERVVEAMLYSLKRLPKEPYLALIQDPSISHLVNESAFSSKEGNEICRRIFREALMDKVEDDQQLDEVIEFSARLLLSLLTVKPAKPRNKKELRAFLERRLLPAVFA